MTGPRHVVVTGAAGFVGSRLVRRLLTDPAFAEARLTLNDVSRTTMPADPRITVIEGDFGVPAIQAALIEGGVDILYHTGGVLGGAAEADPARARQVNIDATLSLFEQLYALTTPPRLVFASSIAVFGSPFPAVIDDATRPNPSMIYGAQKAMIEIAIEQASARGWIDGLALRLPGIVAKPHADARMKAAFLNRLFEVFAGGADLTLPVAPDGTTWLLSIPACIDALIHGGLLPGARLGPRRTFTLPAQNIRFDALVAALQARHPASRTRITYAPEAALVAQFGCQPPLTTALADALGFRHDGDLATLIAQALSPS